MNTTSRCIFFSGAAAITALAGDATSWRAEAGEAHANRRLSDVACFLPANEAERDQILQDWGALPPAQLSGASSRYENDTIVWTGFRNQNDSGCAEPALLAYSFPADGTDWGLFLDASIATEGPNTLNSNLMGLFGADALDLGREHVRQALAGWEYLSGMQYFEVADDNTPMDEVTTASSTKGDIRIGAVDLPESGFAAYNAFPSALGSVGIGGGDMVINGGLFAANQLGDPTDSYRLLRNTVAHEHGHGLGFMHVVPCTEEKLMEPFLTDLFDQQQTDDIRAGGRNYGDRFAGNSNVGLAHDFGDLTVPSLRSVHERALSTNGVNGFLLTSEDWFKFTISSQQDVTITVNPTGGTYEAMQQLLECIGFALDPVRETTIAGDHWIELRDETAIIIWQLETGSGPGSTKVLSAPGLAAGTYSVRVVDQGPNDPNDQYVQLYDLSIEVGTEPLSPTAVAGIRKRIDAGENCHFIGDIISHANESGATLTQYDWDLDGDGTFETTNDPRPSTVYATEGDVNVSLRVTDSNGRTAEDTIVVTVVGNFSSTDITGDGVTDGADLAALLALWGTCPAPCSADFNGDGVVDGADLAELLANWTI